MKEESLLTAALRDVLSLPGVTVTETSLVLGCDNVLIEFVIEGGGSNRYEAHFAQERIAVSEAGSSFKQWVERSEGVRGALLALAALLRKSADSTRDAAARRRADCVVDEDGICVEPRCACTAAEDEPQEQGEGEGEDKGNDEKRGRFWPMGREDRRAEVVSAVKAIVGASGSVWLKDVFWKVDKAAEYCDKDRTHIVELEEERDRLKHELRKEERQSKEWHDALEGAKAALLVMRADRDSLKDVLATAVCISGPYNPYDHIDSAHRLLTGMGVAVLGTLTDRITSLGGTLKASLSWHRDGCRCPTHAVDDTAGDEGFEDGRPIDVEAVEAAYKPRPALVGNEEVPAFPKCDVEQCIVDHDAAGSAETFQCESTLGDPSND